MKMREQGGQEPANNTEGRITLFTSELVESDLIMLQKNRAGHGQGQGYKF